MILCNSLTFPGPMIPRSRALVPLTLPEFRWFHSHVDCLVPSLLDHHSPGVLIHLECMHTSPVMFSSHFSHVALYVHSLHSSVTDMFRCWWVLICCSFDTRCRRPVIQWSFVRRANYVPTLIPRYRPTSEIWCDPRTIPRICPHLHCWCNFIRFGKGDFYSFPTISQIRPGRGPLEDSPGPIHILRFHSVICLEFR